MINGNVKKKKRKKKALPEKVPNVFSLIWGFGDQIYYPFKDHLEKFLCFAKLMLG